MAMTMTAGRGAADLERRYYMAMILAIIACVIVGFSRSFFLRPLFPAVHAPGEAWFYVHGSLFTLWLALLLTQASLIGAGNRALHMRLGVAAYALVPLMVAMGTIGSLIAARRPGGFIDIPDPPLKFLAIPLFNIVWFAIFAGLALYWRRTAQTHKRLILLASIGLSEAALARFQIEPFLSSPPAAFWSMTLFLVPMIGWDLYSRKRLHPVTLWGGLFLVSQGPLRTMIAETQGWMVFAKWATAQLG
jgi:uncharacterized membrane protein YozB (DUF420 family)